jgi:hypothetical protein
VDDLGVLLNGFLQPFSHRVLLDRKGVMQAVNYCKSLKRRSWENLA